MSAIDPVGPAPETRSVRFVWLLFGACAAPLAWLGQIILGYAVTATVCYPGDHPETLPRSGALFSTLVIFDVIALVACMVGGLVSWHFWRVAAYRQIGGVTPRLTQSRVRFLALWGLFSSLWFFFAVLFNTIASLTVPPCPG